MHIKMTSESCSGCTACKAVCPKKAISFSDDIEGFQIPIVSEKLCIDCGLCVKVCPALNYETKKRDNTAYAGMWKNEAVRKNSASGAFFPAVADHFINKLQGYVCGCVFDENIMPIHIISNKWEDVLRMGDSKYVQSNMKNCITEIAELLINDKYVLFSGTSCQVSGLLSLLNSKKINTEKLLTIDFFCHGVPSPLVWKKYLEFYEEKKHRKVVSFRFRNKDYGWGKQAGNSSHLNCVHFMNTIEMGKVKKDNFTRISRMWKSIFFSNICIRKYCHSCPYATINKPSDITMGDFWGIGSVLPEFDDGKGCSVIIPHNEKGRNILNKISCLTLMEVNTEEAIKKQANAFAPSPENEQRNDFWKDFHNKPFLYAAKKYFRYTFMFRVLYKIDRILFELGIHRLRW